MKKRFIPSLALFFALLMFISNAANAVTLTEETAAKRGFDVFYAWYTDTYSSYQYYARTYQSPFRVVVDKYKDNSAWNGLLAAWRVATFDLESEAEYALKEVGYYETFLFDMLYDEKTGAMGSPFVSAMATATDTFHSVAERIEASALQELIETDAWVTASTLFDSDDLKKQTALWNKVQTMDAFMDALEIIGDVSDYVGYCSSALDVIDRLSKLESLLSASAETKRILNDLYNNCNDNPALKAALLEYNGIVSDSMNKELLRGFMINKTAIGEIAQKMASDIYEGVVQKCNLYGFAFAVGQKMGKFTADGLFGTSDLISSYYQCLAMYRFENLLLPRVRAYEDAFHDNPSDANARIFNAATGMLYKTYAQGYDVLKDYTDVSNQGGVLSGFFSSMKKSEYEDFVKKAENLKTSLSSVREYDCALALSRYQYALETLSEAAADAADMTPVQIPVSEDAYKAELKNVETADMPFSTKEVGEDLKLSEDLTMFANLTLSGGTLDLNGHTLTVHGDVLQSGGTMFLNGGTLNVGGDYVIASGFTKLSNGGIELGSWSTGILRMDDDNENINIQGNMGVSSRVWYDETIHINLTAGIIRIGKNFYFHSNYDRGYYSTFNCSDTHTVIFNGEGTQRIFFSETGSSGFANVKFENPYIQFDSGIRAFDINEDIHLTIRTSDFSVNGTLDLQHCLTDFTFDKDFTFGGGTLIMRDRALTVGKNLTVNGTLQFDKQGLTVGESLTVNGGLQLGEKALTLGKDLIISGNVNMNRHNLTVPGNLTLTGGRLDLMGSTMSVTGDILQSGGTMFLNGGTLNVGGDYVIASGFTKLSNGGIELGGWSTGILRMDDDNENINIQGNMGVSSRVWYDETIHINLTAGIIRIGKNFYFHSNYDRGYYSTFNCSGAHTVIFNGEGKQSASFSGSNSQFNRVVLTKDMTNYAFNPEPCWNTLVEAAGSQPEVEVSSVRLSARTITLTAGKTAALTASVLPEDASDKTLIWTSSNENVATVSAEGLVTAVSQGTALIRAEAKNGLYRTCAVTVQELLSGVLTVGSVKALPGKEAVVPVTVWDNPGFAAMRLTMTYDSAALTLKDILPGDLLSSDNFSYEDSDGFCNILWYDSADMRSDGVLFSAVFQSSDGAKIGADTEIALNSGYGNICKANHENISFAIENGGLLFRQVLKGDIYEDDAVDIHDILPLQRHLTGLEQLDARQMVAADMDGNGSVGMPDIVMLAQTLVKAALTGSLFQESKATEEPFVISVGDAAFDNQGYAEIPVRFSGCPGVAAFRLQVCYDADSLELLEIQAKSDPVRENLCHNLSDSERGATWITWYSPANRSLNGDTLTLRFKLSGNAPNGRFPISVSFRKDDICTELLEALSPNIKDGTLHSAEYLSGVQVAEAVITHSENAGKLTGNLLSDGESPGTDAIFCVVFFSESGKMTNLWMKSIQIHENLEFSIEGAWRDSSKAKLLILREDSLAALCSAPADIKA